MFGLLTREKNEEKDKEAKPRHGEHEDLLDDGIDRSPVIKVIEVVATSTAGFDDAIANGVKTAARSLRHITGADVKHMTVAVRNGRVAEYRVDLKIAFALDEDDEEDED